MYPKEISRVYCLRHEIKEKAKKKKGKVEENDISHIVCSISQKTKTRKEKSTWATFSHRHHHHFIVVQLHPLLPALFHYKSFQLLSCDKDSIVMMMQSNNTHFLYNFYFIFTTVHYHVVALLQVIRPVVVFSPRRKVTVMLSSFFCPNPTTLL